MQTAEEFPALRQERRPSFDRSSALEHVEESEDEGRDDDEDEEVCGHGEGYVGDELQDQSGGSSSLLVNESPKHRELIGSGRGAISVGKSFSVFETGRQAGIREESEEEVKEEDEESEDDVYDADEADEDDDGAYSLGSLRPRKARRSALHASLLAGGVGAPRKTDLTLISLNQYTFQQELGRGSQAIVFRAKDTLTGKDVALRVIQGVRLRDLDTASADATRSLRVHGNLAALTKAIKTELAILRRVDHPNLIRFVEVLDLETYDESVRGVAIAMELVPGRELLADKDLVAMDADFWDLHTKTTARPLLPEAACCQIFAQVLAGLEYMHYHGIFHGDVKPSNIMYNEATGRVVLVDFGVSRAADLELRNTDLGPCIFRSHGGFGKGTLLFFNPESFSLTLGATYDAAEADVWAASLTLYALLFGHLPLHGATERGDLMQLMQTADELPLWEPKLLGILSTKTSRGGAAVCRACLRLDRATRLVQISKIMQHEWMKPAQTAFNTSNGNLRREGPLADHVSDAEVASVGKPVTAATGWTGLQKRIGQLESCVKVLATSTVSRLSDLGETLALESRLSELGLESRERILQVSKDLERATIRIQAAFRMHCARRMAARIRLQKGLDFAATKIQSAFRMRQARHQAEAMRKSQKTTVAAVKSTITGELDAAARSIQSFYRRRHSRPRR